MIELPETTLADLQQYYDALMLMDWAYARSDDSADWRRGRRQQTGLFNWATALGPEALDLYFAFVRGQQPEPPMPEQIVLRK